MWYAADAIDRAGLRTRLDHLVFSGKAGRNRLRRPAHGFEFRAKAGRFFPGGLRNHVISRGLSRVDIGAATREGYRI